MSQADWLSILGWGTDELEDLRFVGYSYIKQGKYDIACTFFEALVILNPDSVYDMQTLGALYLQKGNNLMALNYIEKALKLNPKDLPTLLNRSKALFALATGVRPSPRQNPWKNALRRKSPDRPRHSFWPTVEFGQNCR